MERNEVYDFYKALLMFGVVWGHSITYLGGGSSSCNITWFLRLYDMPFFMLISGHFLVFSVKKYSLKKLLLDKITTILAPTLFWGLLLSRGHSWNGGYYFLCAVFFSSIAVAIVEKICKSNTIKWTIYFVLIVVLNIINHKLFNLCYLFPFFLLGYKAKEWYNKNRIIWLFLFVLGICFWDNSYSIWNSDINILHGYKVLLLNIYRFVIGCAALATMRMLFDMGYNYFKSLYPKQTSLISKTIGQETLSLYISHVFILKLIGICIKYMDSHIGYNPLMINERLLVYVISPILSMVVLWACYIFVKTCKSHRFFSPLWGFKLNPAK